MGSTSSEHQKEDRWSWATQAVKEEPDIPSYLNRKQMTREGQESFHLFEAGNIEDQIINDKTPKPLFDSLSSSSPIECSH